MKKRIRTIQLVFLSKTDGLGLIAFAEVMFRASFVYAIMEKCHILKWALELEVDLSVIGFMKATFSFNTHCLIFSTLFTVYTYHYRKY